MNRRILNYTLLTAIVVVVIVFAGGHQLPKYASRLISLAILAVVDILYWQVLKRFLSGKGKLLQYVYWLPLTSLMLFFMAGLIAPYTEWPAVLRIYFPAVLLILLIGKGLFLFGVIVSDVILLPWNLFRKILFSKPLWLRPGILIWISAFLASMVMLLYAAGMFFWVRNFEVRTVELKVKGLPKEFDGYRVVQLSDIHLGTFLNEAPLRKLSSLIAEQHPDLILFTGDMVNFSTVEALPFEPVMKEIKAPGGVYAILGNHDYGEYNQWDSPQAKEKNDQDLFAFYNRIGWHLLRNENAIIPRDSASLAILGVENWSVTKRFGKKGDLKKAYSGTEKAQFRILMSHDPSHWDAEVTRSYPEIGLTLSGHTHAFQLAIETAGIKWSPASLLFTEWGGLYTHESSGVKQYLYVNRGTGTLGYPGRIFTRPEVTLLILRTQD
jgi:uncharacterized protein